MLQFLSMRVRTSFTSNQCTTQWDISPSTSQKILCGLVALTRMKQVYFLLPFYDQMERKSLSSLIGIGGTIKSTHDYCSLIVILLGLMMTS